MTDWIEHTKKNIPELLGMCTLFDEIDNPMLMWLELDDLFLKAARNGNDDLIERIFAESDYYHNYENNPKGDDYSASVALAFIEHFLDDKAKIPYVIKYFSKEDFIGCKELLTYHNSDKKYWSVLRMYES